MVFNRSRAILAAFFLLAFSLPASSEVVGNIAVEPDIPVFQDLVYQSLSFKIGDPYDYETLERTASLLRATNLFQKVDFTTQWSDNQATIIYYLEPKKTISDINPAGNFFLLSSFLTSRIPVKVGDPFDDDVPRKIETALLDLYRDQGFTGTEVTVQILPDDPFGKRVTAHIKEGKLMVIRGYEITGASLFSREELAQAAGFLVGGYYSPEKNKAIEVDLLSFLRNKGFLEARCRISTSPIRGSLIPPLDITRPFSTLIGFIPGFYQGVKIIIDINEGALWDLSLEGVPFGLERDVKKALTFLESGEIDRYEIQSSSRRIKRVLQEEGYFNASVHISQKPPPNPAVTVTIDPGPRGRKFAFRFEGISSKAEQRSEKALSSLTREPLTSTLVGRIRRIVLNTLYSLGYLNAKVLDPQVTFLQDLKKWELKIIVIPGQIYKMDSLVVSGNEALSHQEIVGLLGWEPNQPFDPSRLDEGQRRVITAYRSRGYLGISARFDFDKEPAGITADYNISEGPLFSDGKVVIVGNQRTSTSFIRRLTDISEGTVADPGSVTQSQLALYQTGLFSKVEVNFSRISPTDPVVDYVIRVRETLPRRLSFSIGYGDQDGWRGKISFRDRNLFGKGQQGSLSIKLSEKAREFAAGIRNPYLLKGWALEIQAFEQKREHASFDEGVIGGRITLERLISEHLRAFIGSRIESFDYPSLASDFLDFPGLTDIGLVVALPLTLRYDNRDDFLFPSKGAILEATVEPSFPAIGSDWEFTRLRGKAAAFFTPWSFLTLGISLRGGRILDGGEDETITFRERFFLGGATSIRGFAPEELGPQDSAGNPIGGTTMVAASLETRTPISKKMEGSVFFDTGGVFLDDKIEAEGMRETAGFGLRYRTPVGPVRLDLAWLLDPLPEEDPFRVHFSLGYPF